MKLRVRRAARWLCILLLVLLGNHLVTMAWSDPERMAPIGEGTRVWVVDHGYHSGVILSPASLRRAAIALASEDPDAAARLRWLASRYPDADWLEIGWGDAAFYQQTPGIADVDVLLGLRAILWPTEAVLQVVPGWGAPEVAFRGSDVMALNAHEAGLQGLAARLAETVPEPVPATWLGPSLYGQGVFYPAELDYHLFRTCNHWVAWLLRGAGMPASPLPGTFSTTLMAELRWRS